MRAPVFALAALALLPACMTPVPATDPASMRAPQDFAGADLAEALFAEFCIGKTAAESEAAIRASGRFKSPEVFEFQNTGARYALYPLIGHDRASVSVSTEAITGLQCSVGVNNRGPNLYDDGRVEWSL